MSSRAGVTLLELIVVVAILGIMAGIVGVAAPHAITVTSADSATTVATNLRAGAVREGRVATGQVSLKGGVVVVSAYPDGRVLADSSMKIDALSGRVDRATK